MTPIKYIGKRDSYTDGLYGTRIQWNRGETKDVPDEIALKMLKHPDQYIAGKQKDSTPTPEIKVAEAETEDDLQLARDIIANMEPEALDSYANQHFGQKLDMRKSVGNLRTEVTRMVDQYGLA